MQTLLTKLQYLRRLKILGLKKLKSSGKVKIYHSGDR